jgi:IS5 family transposase
MKAYIGVDADSGLVRTVVGTAANVNDLKVASQLLRGEEHAAFGGDAGYQDGHSGSKPRGKLPCGHVAMRPRKRKLLNPFVEPDFMAERVEKM